MSASSNQDQESIDLQLLLEETLQKERTNANYQQWLDYQSVSYLGTDGPFPRRRDLEKGEL